MYSEQEIEYSLLAEKPINIVGIIMKYLIHWKWILASILISILISIIYIIYATPKYKVETSILFRDDMRGGGVSELNILKEMGLITQKNNVDNEVEVLKKSLIVEDVVLDSELYISYSESRPFKIFDNNTASNIIPAFIRNKRVHLYKSQSPIIISFSDSIAYKLSKPIKLKAQTNDNNIVFRGAYHGDKFEIKATRGDSTVILPFGKINISQHEYDTNDNDRVIDIIIMNPSATISQFQSALKIDLTSKTSSVANISFVSLNGLLGHDFLQSYIESYNQKGIDDQINLADKTSKVIDEHLSQLSSELSNVETQAQDYRQSKGLTNISSQADLYSSQSANVSQRLMDIESQLAIVSNLSEFVSNISNHTQMIPSNSGITSASLISQIEQYNKLVLERNRLSRIASSSNQTMIDLNNNIESTFNSVRIGLQNEKNNLEIQQQDISSMLSQNYARLRAIPQQEREYSDILRQQSVKEDLFVYLLQKKEEKYMNMASVMPNSRLIDNIVIKGKVKPNARIIIIIFLAIGIIVPIIIIMIRNLLRYQVVSKEELEEISNIPVLGEIPITNSENSIVVEENNNDSFNELMRLLRANLLFIINGKENKVINMLSSLSGEGKTFITINLAKSLALLDKKVLIIELDIRKPKLSNLLNIDNETGITLYLSENTSIDNLIKPSNIHKNVSIITSGSIPPNPNELLAKPLLGELVNSLRDNYDYIIIDTAPIGVVSDSFLLNKISDVNLYIVKSGYTPKKFIEEANLYYKDEKLKRMYFILNGIDLNKKSYEYGYRHSYEYGYPSIKKS